MDKTGYLYHGRSYGVGISVGLVSDALSNQNYSYQETGYLTNIECEYNKSTDYGLTLLQDSTNPAIPQVYWAGGTLPNGNHTGYVLADLGTSNNILGVQFVPSNNSRRSFIHPAGSTSYLGIAAGSNYTQLNATQCKVIFTPTAFNISVNTTEKLISVTPLLIQAMDIEPKGWITYQVAHSLLATAMVETTLYTSVYGNALLSNVNKVLAQPTTETDEQKTLRGIEEAFQSMLDDYLSAFASAQLMIADDTAKVPVIATTDTEVIGARVYIICIAVIKFLVVFCFLTMMAITAGWRGLPMFDHTDLKSLVVGSSIASSGVGDEVIKRHQKNGSTWTGDPADQVAGDIRVHLKLDDEVVLVPSHSNE